MCKIVKCITFWLVFIGALNWGLVGLFNFDLVSFLLGEMTLWSRIIYVTIGVSAIIYGALLYVCNHDESTY